MRRAAVAAAVLAGFGGASGVAVAAFTAQTSNSGNTFTAASDFVAPRASALAVGKTEGGEPGFLRQGGTFKAYASVSDTGNPASGTSTVSGDIGGGAFGMPAGAASFFGQTYTHSSATQTAPALLAEGNATLSVTMADGAANSRTQTQAFTVDNTKPSGTDVQATNTSGGTAGTPEQGDTLTYSFSEPIDRQSVISGWTPSGDPRDVVVRIDYAVLGLGFDTLTVYNAANTTQIAALGSVRLNSGLLSVAANRTFGASGTPSRLTRSGNAMVITLGTPSQAALNRAAGTAVWTPDATAFDRAGNTALPTPATEQGASDVEF